MEATFMSPNETQKACRRPHGGCAVEGARLGGWVEVVVVPQYPNLNYYLIT
jgi:hypothetical protein